MEQKKAQLLTIALALLLAVSGAWLLLRQSPESNGSRQNGQVEEQASPAAESDSGPRGEGDNRTASRESGKNGTARGDRARREPPGLRVVTGAFVQDLADFVVSSYHPEWGVDNPRDRATLNISFRALNVRYGTQLIGLRHSQSGLSKARQEILSNLLDPDVLKHAYIRYADSFVQAMIRRARDSTRRFRTPGDEVRERSLDDSDVAGMLQLGASYLRDVSAVLELMGRDEELNSRIGDYLEAKEQAVHFNYMLNQIVEEIERQQKGSSEGNEDPDLREKRESVVKRYGRAIARRENARQELVGKVRQETGEQLNLDVTEILYIAEWVHRRLPDKENRPAIVTSGRLLEDLADRLAERAEALEG